MEGEEGVVEVGEEGVEGGEVEKVVGRFVCFWCGGWCCCCCAWDCEEDEEDEEEDDIRGVVARSVMCRAREGCCEGRLAILGL